MLKIDPELTTLKLGNQNTLLHLTATDGQTKFVKYMLSKTAVDSQALNLFNKTAFQMAFEAGNIEVCELIRSVHDLSYFDPDSFV